MKGEDLEEPSKDCIRRLERENQRLREGLHQAQRMRVLWLQALEDLKQTRKTLTEQNKRLSSLHQISSDIAETLDQDQLFERIMSSMGNLIALEDDWPMGIFLVDPDGGMRLVANRGGSDDFITAHEGMRVGDCLCGRAALGEIVTTSDCTCDPRRTITAGASAPHGHLILPLRAKDRVVGVFYYHLPPDGSPTEMELETFVAISNQIGMAIDNARLYEEMRDLSIRDALTGLNNRRQFLTLLEAELSRGERFQRPLALLMIDIDFFKRVNDIYGHQAGDAVLKEVAQLLKINTRLVDEVCRYGGEELAVLLPETGTGMALQVAERLRSAIEQTPFDVGDGRSIHITASVGVAFCGDEGESVESLISAADGALYTAKREGRNRVCAPARVLFDR